MASNPLLEYIANARTTGATDDQIREALLKNGWQVADVNHALNPLNAGSTLTPPPPAPHFGMWVGFLYVILFISLYVSATALGGILHYAVDEMIPDSLDTVNASQYIGQYLMQTYIASLIVGFPIFAALFLVLKNQTIKAPTVKGLRIRKILIYITLIGTFLIMLGHLIATVYGFLGGTVTQRAIGHLGVTFLVAGSIFVYFLMDVWGDRKQS